jgi:ribosome-binding protein aMBF1 (putative translation factor)
LGRFRERLEGAPPYRICPHKRADANAPGVARAAQRRPSCGSALGAAIRQAREDAGLTQAQLAVRADLAVGTLSRLEAGKTDPSWVELRAIAETLGISLTVLGRLIERDQRLPAPGIGSTRKKPRTACTARGVNTGR